MLFISTNRIVKNSHNDGTLKFINHGQGIRTQESKSPNATLTLAAVIY